MTAVMSQTVFYNSKQNGDVLIGVVTIPDVTFVLKLDRRLNIFKGVSFGFYLNGLGSGRTTR
jgi:hypothetical protein